MKDVMTVTEFLEDIKAAMCDSYCFYRHMEEMNSKLGHHDPEALEEVCEDCPMNLLAEGRRGNA